VSQSPADVAQLVGLADETWAEHKARHPELHPHCPRCIYHQLHTQWEQGHGCHRHVFGGQEIRTVWLAQRSANLGGVWGLGCLFCSAYSRRPHVKTPRGVKTAPKVTRGSTGTSRGWSCFEVRALSQIACRGVRQHADTFTHQLATRAYFAQQPAVIVSGPAGLVFEDAKLFRGGVPQVSDWITAWRACQTPVSFSAASKFGITADFIYSSRRGAPVSRKAFASMAKVMSLCLRARKRRLLRASSSIALALDDRGSYRLLRFKCHMVRPASEDPLKWLGSVSGVLMVLHRGGTASTAHLDDMSDDYSRRMSESVVLAVRRLCTLPSGDLDQDAFDTICKHIRAGVADGAAPVQKALAFLASGAFANMLACVRDMSHKVRIATGDSLLADDGFQAWWNDVFGDRHALVPDIQNSEAWTEKLILCQKLLLGADEGVRESGCWTVQRTISFAKQRFDSYASPQLKFCVLLVAIAMLLAYQASDTRVKTDARSRAQRRLEQMPHFVLPAGLSATFSAEALEFVRIFDVADHDPALSWSQARTWRARIQSLFVDGHLWADVGSDEEKTPLHIVWGQAKSAKPIFYGDKVVHLFRQPSRERLASLSGGLHVVVRHMFDRLDVDFHIERPEVAFTAMDIDRWDQALKDRRDGSHAKHDLLQSHAKIMFKHWHLNADRGVRELEGCAIMLLRDERERRSAGQYLDNRTLWARTLEASFLTRVSSLGSCSLRMMPDLVPIYLSFMDGTGQVERNLGSLLQVLEAHSGPLSEDGDMASALTEVLLDGPEDESGLAIRPNVEVGSGSSGDAGHALQDVTVLLQPTDLTREFAQQWLESHGRRFRVYAGKTPQPKPDKPRPGTLARVVFDSKVARNRLAARADRAPPAAEDMTLLGVARAHVTPRNSALAPSLKMKRFANTTALRRTQLKQMSEARDQARRTHTNPHSVSTVKPANKLRLGHKLQWKLGVREVEARNPGVPIRVLDCCSVAQQSLECNRYTLVRAPGSERLVAEINRADMLLWDHPWALDRRTADQSDERLLGIMFIVIAVGKAVLPHTHWRGAAPHISSSVLRFARAASQDSLTLVLVDEFRRKFPRLSSVIKSAAGVANSRWVVVNNAPPPSAKAEAKPKAKAKAKAHAKPQEVLTIASLEDIRDFVHKYRRIARSGGVASEYFRPSVQGRFGLRRVRR